MIHHYIKKYVSLDASVIVGPGDDAAALRGNSQQCLLLTKDLLIEGTHFRRDWMTARQIGAKSILVNLSDIAAMGASARYVMVGLGFPQNTSFEEADQLLQGMHSILKPLGIKIIGGDVNRAPCWVISVTALGEQNKAWIKTRHAAKEGDLIFVSGSLGESALGLLALKQKRRGSSWKPFIERHIRPPCRLGLAKHLSRLKTVHAMMDLSDGLGSDLSHILKASGVGAVLDEDKLPLSASFISHCAKNRQDPRSLAMWGGEDYELLWTMAPDSLNIKAKKFPSHIGEVPVTCVGQIVSKKKGSSISLRKPAAFRHFS